MADNSIEIKSSLQESIDELTIKYNAIDKLLTSSNEPLRIMRAMRNINADLDSLFAQIERKNKDLSDWRDQLKDAMEVYKNTELHFVEILQSETTHPNQLYLALQPNTIEDRLDRDVV